MSSNGIRGIRMIISASTDFPAKIFQCFAELSQSVDLPHESHGAYLNSQPLRRPAWNGNLVFRLHHRLILMDESTEDRSTNFWALRDRRTRIFNISGLLSHLGRGKLRKTKFLRSRLWSRLSCRSPAGLSDVLREPGI